MTSNGQYAAIAGAVSPAPAATTMQAIVQDTYGSADVLRLAWIATPEIADAGCLSRCSNNGAQTQGAGVQGARKGQTARAQATGGSDIAT